MPYIAWFRKDSIVTEGRKPSSKCLSSNNTILKSFSAPVKKEITYYNGRRVSFLMNYTPVATLSRKILQKKLTLASTLPRRIKFAAYC